MAPLTIHLSEPLEKFVQDRARDAGYATASDYVRSLIEARALEEAGAVADEQLIEELRKGLVGPFYEVNEEFWARKMAAVEERLGRLNGPS